MTGVQTCALPIFSILSYKAIQILGQRQKGMIARSMLLRPGGPLASELAQHAVVLKVNDWVFCHGGLLPHHGKSSTAIWMKLFFV